MRLYISGPMTGYVDYNFPAFFEAEEAVRSLGHDPVNPATRGVQPGWEWEDYLRADIRDLMTCDGVVTLPNWRNSRGARFEVRVARTLAMPIIRLRDLEGAQ